MATASVRLRPRGPPRRTRPGPRRCTCTHDRGSAAIGAQRQHQCARRRRRRPRRRRAPTCAPGPAREGTHPARAHSRIVARRRTNGRPGRAPDNRRRPSTRGCAADSNPGSGEVGHLVVTVPARRASALAHLQVFISHPVGVNRAKEAFHLVRHVAARFEPVDREVRGRELEQSSERVAQVSRSSSSARRAARRSSRCRTRRMTISIARAFTSGAHRFSTFCPTACMDWMPRLARLTPRPRRNATSLARHVLRVHLDGELRRRPPAGDPRCERAHDAARQESVPSTVGVPPPTKIVRSDTSLADDGMRGADLAHQRVDEAHARRSRGRVDVVERAVRAPPRAERNVDVEREWFHVVCDLDADALARRAWSRECMRRATAAAANGSGLRCARNGSSARADSTRNR